MKNHHQFLYDFMLIFRLHVGNLMSQMIEKLCDLVKISTGMRNTSNVIFEALVKLRIES